jgi:hypothetical protein
VFFPEQLSPPLVVPKDFNPEARIVMAPVALDQLTDALLKAAETRKAASQQSPSTISKAQ